MPHEKEDLITSPFPPGHHLIITLSGSHLDPPSPILVAETEPSSIIYYLLNTDAYQHFLAGSIYQTKQVCFLFPHGVSHWILLAANERFGDIQP